MLLSVVCRIVPLSPHMPEGGLDPSWRYALNQAMSQGLVFGRDIIFTLGPYAPVYTAAYHPATDGLMVGAALYFALSTGLLLVFLGIRHRLWMPVLVTIALMISASYAGDVPYLLYGLLVALAVTEIDDTCPDRPIARRRLLALGGIFLPLGLLPLIKGSFFIISAVAVLLTAGLWCYRARYVEAVAVVLLPIGGSIAFWLIAGQPIGGLPDYLRAIFLGISGYTEAMSVEGQVREIAFYLGMGVILLLSLIGAQIGRTAVKVYLVVMLGMILFLAFKIGFVRHDGHARAATSFLLLTSLCLAPIIKLPLRLASVAGALGLAVLSANIYSRLDLPVVVGIFSDTYTRAFAGLKTRLSDGNELVSRFKAANGRIAQDSTLPKLEGTADIYSYNQSSIFAVDNDWDPRPVFQSYAAYTPAMLKLNARHLQGDKAPDNIIFNIEPIDGRMPSMEDGASWPAILTNYRPVKLTDRLLLLKKVASPTDIREGLISTGRYSMGEKVDVPKNGRLVFAEIDISQSLIGRAANFLFKPSPLRIEFTLANGQTRTYRLISGMVRTGILVSPLVENTMEFSLLYDRQNFMINNNVRSFRIFPASLAGEWNEHYDVKFKALYTPEYDGIKKLIKFDPVFSVPENISTNEYAECDGGIDTVNGVAPQAGQNLGPLGWLDLKGWLAESSARGIVPQEKLVVLTDSTGRRSFFQTRSVTRPDVGAYFHKPQLSAAGYAAMIDMTGVADKYTIGLAYIKKNVLRICSGVRISVQGARAP
ncbi:hypothetical protein [Bordetella genomosp. 11]|nr:hypothetical protein [Bordetella genomosp. 11]